MLPLSIGVEYSDKGFVVLEKYGYNNSSNIKLGLAG